MNKKLYYIVIFFLTISCKTITISDNNITVKIPDDIHLVDITAGNFYFGENPVLDSIDYPYQIMKYPVTNTQYVNYLYLADSLGTITIDTSGVYGYYNGDKFWQPGIYKFADFTSNNSRIGFYPPDAIFTRWRYVDNRKEFYYKHPITHITWFGANAFAKFYGMRLPSIKEWEKAARSNHKIDYPWGNELMSVMANYQNSEDIYDNDTTPVGFYSGDYNTNDSCSPYGLYDMAGNVWEWTSSWWRDSSGRVIKGGSWNSKINSTETDTLVAYELMVGFIPAIGYLPENYSKEIGFRCVKAIND